MKRFTQSAFFVVLAALFALQPGAALAVDESFGGRDIILTVPTHLPPEGQRAMVVALHGGGGNARFMQSHLGMDAVAEKNGFLVAYLNGTHAARLLPGGMHAWNSGGDCCGEPFEQKIDDVAYIRDAVSYLTQKYGIDPARIYVTGHSNGAMMAQLMLCETDLFRAGVTMSGPVNPDVTSCPAARGKKLLSIHGEQDENVPIAGGKGTKGPMHVREDVLWRSEASAQALFEQSGASYTLFVVPGADHGLEHMDAAIQKSEGISLAEKAARFLGLAPAN